MIPMRKTALYIDGCFEIYLTKLNYKQLILHVLSNILDSIMIKKSNIHNNAQFTLW